VDVGYYGSSVKINKRVNIWTYIKGALKTDKMQRCLMKPDKRGGRPEAKGNGNHKYHEPVPTVHTSGEKRGGI